MENDRDTSLAKLGISHPFPAQADGYVDPATAAKERAKARLLREEAAAAPTFVFVDTESTEGMDDDMKERTLARKARERARRDRGIADEKRTIATRGGAEQNPSPPRPPPFPRDYVVSYETVNVREAPRLSAKTVGALPRGAVVRVSRVQGNWALLAGEKNGGRWMMIDGEDLGLPKLLEPKDDAKGPPPPAAPPPPPPAASLRTTTLHRPSPADRPRFETIDDRRQLCAVLGTKGAAVRAGPEVDSAKVTVLDYLVTVAYTGNQALSSDGRARVEIDAPCRGWVSLKFLGPESFVPEAPDDD